MVDRSHPRFIGIDRAAGRDQSGAVVNINIHGLLDPLATIETAMDVIGERSRQDRQWGAANHPSLPAGVRHACAFFGIPTADAMRLMCQDAFRRGTGSYAHVLLEEVAEAIEDANEPAKLRAELVQVAAVAMKWIEAIDRRASGGEARHA